MSSVVSFDNTQAFNDAKIRTVIPRSYSIEERLKFLFEDRYNFVAFSLAEAREIFINKAEEYEIEEKVAERHINDFISREFTEYEVDRRSPLKICIDLANGHMRCLLELVKEIKAKFGNKIVIMTGNIANPDTYYDYEDAGVDYCRCTKIFRIRWAFTNCFEVLNFKEWFKITKCFMNNKFE